MFKKKKKMKKKYESNTIEIFLPVTHSTYTIGRKRLLACVRPCAAAPLSFRQLITILATLQLMIHGLTTVVWNGSRNDKPRK